jgi:hypothetical protein
LLLSCHGLWLFSDRLIGGGDRWRSKHHFEVGPQVWGSLSLDGDLEPVTGVEWVGLACARGASEACVFWGTQRGTLIHESSFLRDGTA